MGHPLESPAEASPGISLRGNLPCTALTCMKWERDGRLSEHDRLAMLERLCTGDPLACSLMDPADRPCTAVRSSLPLEGGGREPFLPDYRTRPSGHFARPPARDTTRP